MPKEEKSILDSNQVIPVIPQSLEELEKIMAAHKIQNPKKFAAREESGEWEKLRVQLGGKKSK